MKRVYLAGPDVFYPDVFNRSEILKKQCAKYGLEGVFPLDADIKLEEPLNQEKNGYTIFRGNIGLIKSCDAVLANMIPFRGPSVDAGTAFEMGCGFALGLVVVGYTPRDGIYKNRIVEDIDNPGFDNLGLQIEDFHMKDNLMIHGATCGMIFDTSLQAIEYLADIYLT
jgi:nucleoside 2-deoxyribosyltransferase